MVGRSGADVTSSTSGCIHRLGQSLSSSQSDGSKLLGSQSRGKGKGKREGGKDTAKKLRSDTILSMFEVYYTCIGFTASYREVNTRSTYSNL